MIDFRKISPKAYVATAAVLFVVVLAVTVVNICKRGEIVISKEQLVALDPQNAGINIEVTRPWLSHDAVFNVKKPDGDHDFNRVDVMRVLLQCAQHLRDKQIDKLYLANDGTRVYYLQGSYFKQLGSRYSKDDSWGNAKLCIEMPAHTYTLNDSTAFKPNDTFLGSIQDLTNWNEIMSALLK